MATERARPRPVFDTNVIVAALKSRNPSSPNVELLQRWDNGEFDLLYSSHLHGEYEEKFAARNVDPQRSRQFLENLTRRGILVDVSPSEIVPVISSDPDDDLILACAVKGAATHIVTYDPHFDFLGGQYCGIEIVRPLNFLYLIRGDTR